MTRSRTEEQRQRKKKRRTVRLAFVIGLFIIFAAAFAFWPKFHSFIDLSGADWLPGFERGAEGPGQGGAPSQVQDPAGQGGAPSPGTGTGEQGNTPPQESGSEGQDGPTSKDPADPDAANGTGRDKQKGGTGEVGSVRGGEGSASNEATGGSGKVTLSFVGDILLGDNVGKLLDDVGTDYPYKYVREYLQAPDLTIGNLETPVTTRGEKQDKQYAYRTHPKTLPDLLESGVDIVNLANNHILDYGTTGLLDTFEYLKEAKLSYIGAGRNEEEAYAAHYVEKNGVRIAFLGFSRVVPAGWWKAWGDNPGVASTYDYRKPVAAIEKAKEQADLVIVIPHWGVERQDTPEDYQRDLARSYIDAGADLVVASHAHVLQGFEHYKGKWIAYNLGNFIFTTNNHAPTWETIILNATCSKDGECEISAVPVLTKWAQPKPMDREAGLKLLKRLSGISINAEVRDDGKIEKR
jgi:poly-gamma-glutamate capsule biosynthesis protein CapA/YwtB (metallophosphatase superfamily)